MHLYICTFHEQECDDICAGVVDYQWSSIHSTDVHDWAKSYNIVATLLTVKINGVR